MSSEWKEPGRTWQKASDLSWEEPFDVELPPLPREEEAAKTINILESLEEEHETDELAEGYSTRWEGLRHLGQQMSPVLVPLLFGGLTFLFTLLLALVLKNRSYLPVGHLWPIALIFIAIAIAQGMVLYYTDSDNGRWALGLVGGFLLFLLVGCFAIFGLIGMLILLGVLLVVAFLIARLALHKAPEGQSHIVYAFGKYSRTLFPGLNLLMPWESVEYQLDTRETHWVSPEQRVHISRTEDLSLRASISYRLMPEDAHLAVFHVKSWEESLQELFVATIQTVANDLTPQDIMAWAQGLRAQPTSAPGLSEPGGGERMSRGTQWREGGAYVERSRHSDAGRVRHSDAGGEGEEGASRWKRINDKLFQQMRDRVAPWGVEVKEVHIRDLTLIPHAPSMIDTGPILNPQSADMGTTRGNASASAQPAQAKVYPKKTGTDAADRAQPAPTEPGRDKSGPYASPPQPAPAEAAPSVSKEDKVLMKLYEAVRSGNITDPETIRNIASRFEAIAKDSEASKKVHFDAARAADNLYRRAEKYEEQANNTTGYGYSDDTQPDWSPRRSADDNLMLGG